MNLPKAWPASAAAAILLAGFATAMTINWPGHLSYDSILQLEQGRRGLYNNWHPPVMAWLLGLGDAALPGTGLFILFDGVLAFGSLALLILIPRGRPGPSVMVLAALAAASPLLVLYQGIVWKDVLFADCAVAAFAALACASASHGWRRSLSAVASLVLLIIGSLTRQNGLVILPFAALALGWLLLRMGQSPGRAIGLTVSLTLAVLACAWVANALLELRSDGNPGQQEQIALLQVYDLAGALKLNPHLKLANLADDEPKLDQVLHGVGRAAFTPVRNDPLAGVPAISSAIADADPDAISTAWQETFVTHPWLYLRVRAEDFWWIFATPDIAACRPVFVGIEGPREDLKGLGISARRDARDLALDRYGKSLFGTPVWSHPFYAAIAIGCLVLLLRRRRAPDIVVAAMLLSALAFSASFFFISIACDYRYLYFLDLSAIAALLYLSSDMKSAIEGTP